MIDVHNHLLFGIDDGSRSIEESVSIIRKLSKIGITDIILTPHYIKDSSYVSPKSNNIKLMKQLKEALEYNNINVNLYLGNEIYIDKDIEKLLYQRQMSSLNNTNFLLVELPMSGQWDGYQDVFMDLLNIECQVVLAHPERYNSFQEDFNKIYELRDMGVIFQCNVGSLIGQYGKSAKKVVKRMLKEDLIYMFGTDIHHEKDDYNFLEEAKKVMRKYVSEKKINDLLINNAKEIIQ